MGKMQISSLYVEVTIPAGKAKAGAIDSRPEVQMESGIEEGEAQQQHVGAEAKEFVVKQY
jgi:hypothetical protein